MLFDSSFSSLGSFTLKEGESNWTIRGLLARGNNPLDEAPNDDKIYAPVLDVAHSDPEAVRKASMASPMPSASTGDESGSQRHGRGSGGGASSSTASRGGDSNQRDSAPPSSSQSHSRADLLSSTEIQDDVNPSLLPSGNARELPPQEAAQYPRLQL